jgi:hypothetical protein
MDHTTGRIRRVDVWLLGDGNFPIAKISLPEALVADLPTLLDGVRELRPSADLRATVRAVWRLGSAALRRNRQKGVPLVPADLG